MVDVSGRLSGIQRALIRARRDPARLEGVRGEVRDLLGAPELRHPAYRSAAREQRRALAGKSAEEISRAVWKAQQFM